jgi:PIN domain nuclease of toxin-antitoxin system
MNLLLDTHTFLWFVWDDPKLSGAARSLIIDPGNRKLISAASFWEIAVKVGLKKLDLGEPFLGFMKRQMALSFLDALPITLEHSSQFVALPFHHRDPFDRMLIAQAIWETIPVVSSDASFDAYSVERIW